MTSWVTTNFSRKILCQVNVCTCDYFCLKSRANFDYKSSYVTKDKFCCKFILNPLSGSCPHPLHPASGMTHVCWDRQSSRWSESCRFIWRVENVTLLHYSYSSSKCSVRRSCCRKHESTALNRKILMSHSVVSVKTWATVFTFWTRLTQWSLSFVIQWCLIVIGWF